MSLIQELHDRFDEIEREIEYRLMEARRQVDESRQDDPNSYGAGHDAGEVYALRNLQKWLLGEDE